MPAQMHVGEMRQPCHRLSFRAYCRARWRGKMRPRFRLAPGLFPFGHVVASHRYGVAVLGKLHLKDDMIAVAERGFAERQDSPVSNPYRRREPGQSVVRGLPDPCSQNQKIIHFQVLTYFLAILSRLTVALVSILGILPQPSASSQRGFA